VGEHAAILARDVGFATDVDVWLPLAPDPARDDRGNDQTLVIGRLAPGVTLAQTESELVRIGADLAQEFPVSNGGWSVRLAPVDVWIVESRVRRTLLILLAAVAALLLVASLNVATLQVARATDPHARDWRPARARSEPRRVSASTGLGILGKGDRAPGAPRAPRAPGAPGAPGIPRARRAPYC
jgi:hypothetical protein